MEHLEWKVGGHQHGDYHNRQTVASSCSPILGCQCRSRPGDRSYPWGKCTGAEHVAGLHCGHLCLDGAVSQTILVEMRAVIDAHSRIHYAAGQTLKP